MAAPTASSEDFVLKWNNHRQNFVHVVEELWRQDIFTDVVLCSEGRIFPAHRVILSACSAYFYETLSKVAEHQYPVIFLNGVSSEELAAILKFVYNGEVVVSKDCMQDFFRTAEMLQIKGLAKHQVPNILEQATSDIIKREPIVVEGQEYIDSNVKSNVSHIFRTPPLNTKTPEPFDLTVNRDQIQPVDRRSLSFSESNPARDRSLSPAPQQSWTGLHTQGLQSVVVPSNVTANPPRRGRPPLDASPSLPRVQPPLVPHTGTTTVIQSPSSTAAGRSASSSTDQQQVVRVTVMTPQGLMTMFQCPYCTKRFRRRDHLRQHIRTHTGEKPFACDVCGRRFSQSQQVRIHMRVHMDTSAPSGKGRTKSGSYEVPSQRSRQESESDRISREVRSPGIFPRHSPIPGSSGERAIDLSSPLKAEEETDKVVRKRLKFLSESDKPMYQKDPRREFQAVDGYGENCRDICLREPPNFRRNEDGAPDSRNEDWEYGESADTGERCISQSSEIFET